MRSVVGAGWSNVSSGIFFRMLGAWTKHYLQWMAFGAFEVHYEQMVAEPNVSMRNMANYLTTQLGDTHSLSSDVSPPSWVVNGNANRLIPASSHKVALDEPFRQVMREFRAAHPDLERHGLRYCHI